MKIYFTASVAGKKKLKKEYQAIVEALEKLGFQVKELVLSGEKETSFSKISRLIKKADLVVAEVSFPSVSVGQEISLALESNKPVLALFKEGIKTTLLEINSDERLQLISYNLKKIKKVLKEAIADISRKIDMRFNFFIPPEIINYLNWIAKKRRIPRSVYLRSLIEKDMKNDLQFNKEKPESED